jgi:sec-independent protein translocase protein TatA
MGFLKSIGPTELIIILLIVVMIFGVGKLPQVASSIGKSMRAFREGQKSEAEETEASEPRAKRVSRAKASPSAAKKAAKTTSPLKEAV